MKLGSPLWLLLLIPIAVRVGLWIRDRYRSEGSFEFSSVDLIDEGRSLASSTLAVPFLLEIAGLALLVVALARPQEVQQMLEERRGIDIVIALDASGSMGAEDFQPRNRFGVARELIASFIARRENDRIGIVTFGQRAATRVPITFDREVAREVLATTEIGDHGDGTAIGTAIAASVNRLKDSSATSRVIVLLTDGVNNAGSIEPETAAGLAAQLGIRLYTIGVGSYGPVPVPIRVQNPRTGEIETVYQNIRADLDDEMLRGLATATGGEYFRATDERGLAEIFATIDRLETSRLGAPPDLIVDEHWFRPLAAGLILMALALLMGETWWMRLPS